MTEREIPTKPANPEKVARIVELANIYNREIEDELKQLYDEADRQARIAVSERRAALEREIGGSLYGHPSRVYVTSRYSTTLFETPRLHAHFYDPTEGPFSAWEEGKI